MRARTGTGTAETRRRYRGAAAIGLWALALVSLHAAYALTRELGGGDLAFGWIAPLLLLVGAGHSVRRAARVGLTGARTVRLIGWVAAATLVFGGAGAVLVYYQHLEGGVVVNGAYTVLGWSTGGTIIGLLLGWYDVDRQRAADEAVAARDRTRTTNRRLTVLNRVLRHDVRTEVNVIRGNAELLLSADDGAGADPDDRLATIVRHAQRLAALSERARRIEELIDSPEAAASRDAAGSVRRRAAELGERHPAATFDVDLPAELRVVAHPLLDAALADLLENAVEHNPRSSPRVEVWTTRDDPECVTIHVADDGPGIPPTEVAIVESGRETPLEHSAGVGLWLVSWVVDESGGEVAFRENDPAGSVVSVTLPADPTAGDAARPVASEAERGARRSEDASRAAGTGT